MNAGFGTSGGGGYYSSVYPDKWIYSVRPISRTTRLPIRVLAAFRGSDMPSRFAQILSQRVLVCDGAMGTSIHKLDLSVERDYCGCENCTDILVKSRPTSSRRSTRAS